MKKSDFFYELPEKNIAQTPVEPRHNSRLMIYRRKEEDFNEELFSDIIKYIKKGDVLVLNNSKVLPARIYGVKKSGSKIEFLLLRQLEENQWEVLAKPGKKARTGDMFYFNDKLSSEIVKVKDNGNRVMEFIFDKKNNFYNILDEIGEMPLPHYITTRLKNKDRYQTVFAKNLGSSAAPTAGLHFTNELIDEISGIGVKIVEITLHVGLGTFRPVKEENIKNHIMHSENYDITKDVAEIINNAKKQGNRIIAVGTTSCRTLESAANNEGLLLPGSNNTDIFITPGYKFKIMDGLITNFHLPESTLIMLVSAFLGYKKTMELYNYGVENNYMFYSFGDAMMIL